MTIIQVDLEHVPLTHNCIQKTIIAVKQACTNVGVSPVGFSIDESFCDWESEGENVDTGQISDLISDAVHELNGEHFSELNKKVTQFICEKVTSYFEQI